MEDMPYVVLSADGFDWRVGLFQTLTEAEIYALKEKEKGFELYGVYRKVW